jgi:hypothetical protein
MLNIIERLSCCVMICFCPQVDQDRSTGQDARGRRDTSLLDDFKTEGNHETVWGLLDKNGRKIPDGGYFLIFKINKQSIIKRIVKM